MLLETVFVMLSVHLKKLKKSGGSLSAGKHGARSVRPCKLNALCYRGRPTNEPQTEMEIPAHTLNGNTLLQTDAIYKLHLHLP